MTSAAFTTDKSTPRKVDWLWITAILAVIIFPVLYPAQTSFVADEPLILQRAYDANATGKLATSGLAGSLGYRYGPVSIWIYQAILFFTHNPIAIMSIHIVLFSASIALGLAWIARTLGLWKWGILPLAMSPYVWLYSRLLWDNNFNIPLSVWTVAAYAAFLKRGQAWRLMLAIFLAGAMLLVHLMALPMIVGIFAHLLLARRQDLKRFWPHALTAVLLTVLVGIGYLMEVSRLPRGDHLDSARAMSTWWFALLGPRALSAAWIDYFFPGTWLKVGTFWPAAFAFCRTIALVAFPLTWFGLIIGVRAFRRTPTASLAAEQSSAGSSGGALSNSIDAINTLATFCVITVIIQIALNVAAVTYGHPHYYNGTWAIFAVAMWIGLDRIARYNWGRVIGWMQTIAVGAICVLLLMRIIRNGGTADFQFGATMANQLQLLEDWSKYDERSPMHLDVRILPQSMQGLELLHPFPRKGNEPLRELAVKYTTDDPNNGHVKLVEDKPQTAR